MATHITELAVPVKVREKPGPITVCHFTTAHADLKSRSFHRQCIPLAACGVRIRYVSPATNISRRDGVDFIRLSQHKGRLRRLLGTPALIRALLQQRASLYHFQDPELLPLAFAMKLLFRKRVVYDAYEDFPSMMANKKIIPRIFRPVAGRVMSGTENLAARCFDGLMTADPRTLHRMARRGLSRKIVFYNFPNLAFFPVQRPIAKRYDVVYRGGLSERTGTFVLIEAMRLLKSRPGAVRLLLLGYFDSPADEESLRQRIREFGLESSVEIRGRIDHERMSEALGEARIGVSPLLPVPKFLLNLPVKIFEYWACGLPVVASDLPPMRAFFRNTQAGIVYPAESAAALAQSIGWLLDHPETAAHMGNFGRAAVEQRFNNEREIHKFHRFCERIAAEI